MLNGFWSILFFLVVVKAQTCENYGFQNGSTCACPTGFGGETCSQPACGGNIFESSQRRLTPVSNNIANLTQAGCSCEDGWTGTGCNVCQSSNACQAAYASSGHAPSSSDMVTGSQGAQNNTLTCNTSPRVWAGSQMSCSVDVCKVSFLQVI